MAKGKNISRGKFIYYGAIGTLAATIPTRLIAQVCELTTADIVGPFYVEGSPDVFTNSKKTVRIGDSTGCGDPAVGGSSSVFVNSIGVHRKGDGTSGHGSWVANSSASGSDNVFAG